MSSSANFLRTHLPSQETASEKMKRFVQFVFVAVVIVNCSGDRKVTGPELPSAAQGRSSRGLSEETLRLDISASAQLKSSSGWTYFESNRVPVLLTKTNGRYSVGPASMQALIGSLHRAATRVALLPAFLHSENSSAELRGASMAVSDDPEVVADQYADANYVPDNYSDIYVDQATWNMLYGGTITQDISGDGGVVATVRIDPISTSNPSAKLHLLLNGVEVATVNPRYAPTDEGWYTQDQNSQTFSYYSGQQTSSGGKHFERPAFTLLDRKRDLTRFGLAVPSLFAKAGQYFGLALLPSVANAQSCHECAPYVGGGHPDPCAEEARRVVIGIIAMYTAARRGYVGAMMVALGSTINALHDYGRCAASHPEYWRQT